MKKLLCALLLFPALTFGQPSSLICKQGGTWTVQPGNTANTTAWKVDGSAVTQPVSVGGTVTVGSHNVTNAGTFAVQESGAGLTALQTLDNIVSGAGVNVTQMNGATISMNNGIAGTGVQRVAIASDNTPFPIKIDQSVPGTTNKVDIGTNGTVVLGVGNAIAARVGIDQTTPGTTNAVAVTQVVAHDGVATGVNPLLVGGYSSAAAPTDVSADGDAVRAWHLRNGARATVLTAAGALIGGDAANGLDVDTELAAAAALADATANPTAPIAGAMNEIFNGSTWDRWRSINNGTNTTGTGVPSVGLMGQLDDSAPTGITENQFGNLRMSSRRGLLVEGVSGGTPLPIINPQVSTMTEATGSVGVSSSTILASSSTRQGGYILNSSANVIWIRHNGAAATLAPPSTRIVAGGQYDLTTGGVCYTGAITAISTVASSVTIATSP